MENYYIKRNGKYYPFRVLCENTIPDGIWLVRHFDNNISTTNVDYLRGITKICDVPNRSIVDICAIEGLIDTIASSQEWGQI